MTPIAASPPHHRVILTYGSFDLFHQGHARFLRHLRAFGDELIVGCTTDAFNARRGRQCILPYDARRAMLQSCRLVDRVIAKDRRDQEHTDIVNYNVSVIVMGTERAGEFDHLNEIAQVRYLDRAPDGAAAAMAEFAVADLRQVV